MKIFALYFHRSLIIFILILQANWCEAHPPGLSSLDIVINPTEIYAKVTFSLQDIEAFTPMDIDLDAEVSDQERDAAKPQIGKWLVEQLFINVDGQSIKPTEPARVSFDDQNNAHVEVYYQSTPKLTFNVQSKFLTLLPNGHKQYLSIKTKDGKVLVEKMLGKQNDQVSLPPANATEVTSFQPTFVAFGDFFILGIMHILTGYDHLLFLFALLAVTHSFWPALKIITFFTIAHSITLACASLNFIDLPSNLIEPLIAITIIYVGLENIVRGDHPKGRHWLTFGFGLIHGFGFAGVLREMDITSGGTGILLPLLSFNLGIESGQIAIAILTLPIIWWINNNLKFSQLLLKSCSILVCLMGTYWLLERTILST